MQPPESGKASFFRPIAKFFQQQTAAKVKKTMFFLIIKRKLELISSSEMKCPKFGYCLLIIGWGESDKAILNETHYYLQCTENSFSSLVTCYLVRLDEQFSLALSNFFRAKTAQPPRKIVPHAYALASPAPGR